MFIYLVFFGSLPLIWLEKGAEVIFINRFANSFADTFYIIVSEFGMGYLWLPVIVVFLFIRFADAFLASVIFIMNGMFSFLFKFLILPGNPRPMTYLSAESFTHLIDDFTYYAYNSFPSGHTMTAFSIVFFLAGYIKDNRNVRLFFFIAGLIGFSRIYLLLHFYQDVYAGAVLGGISFYLGEYFSINVIKTPKLVSWGKAFTLNSPKLRLRI